jgi:hypothetical protein
MPFLVTPIRQKFRAQGCAGCVDRRRWLSSVPGGAPVRQPGLLSTSSSPEGQRWGSGSSSDRGGGLNEPEDGSGGMSKRSIVLFQRGSGCRTAPRVTRPCSRSTRGQAVAGSRRPRRQPRRWHTRHTWPQRRGRAMWSSSHSPAVIRRRECVSFWSGQQACSVASHSFGLWTKRWSVLAHILGSMRRSIDGSAFDGLEELGAALYRPGAGSASSGCGSLDSAVEMRPCLVGVLFCWKHAGTACPIRAPCARRVHAPASTSSSRW